MQYARSMVVSLCCLYVIPSCAAISQDLMVKGGLLLEGRRSIRNYVAKLELRRTQPQQIVSKMYIASDGNAFRFDRERVAFSIDRSDEGLVSREAIVGLELKSNHSKYGAQLVRDRSGMKDTSVDLRLLGLYLAPFSNLSPKKYTIEDCLPARVLSTVSTVGAANFNGIECEFATSVDNSRNVERSVYFEKSTGRYIGCDLLVGEKRSSCWITRTTDVAGVEFPLEMVYSETRGAETVFKELVTISELQFNLELPIETFKFSGLSVLPGDIVDVRDNANTEGVDMYWDGKQLVASTLFIRDDFWTFSRTIGLILVFFGIVLGVAIYRVNRRSKSHS